MPKRKNKYRMANESNSVVESVGEEVFTCFKFISSKLEPEGTRGNDENARIVISDTAGWLDDPISGWWAS